VARYNLPQFTKSLSLLKPAILGKRLKILYSSNLIYVCNFFFISVIDNVDIVADNKAEKLDGQTLLKDMMYTQFDWEKEIGLVN